MAAEPVERVPEVDGDRCVLGLAVAASCRACVDACPRSAWVMTDDALGLATDACDGCGICVAACPPGAIGPELPRPIVPAADPSRALVACERAVTGGRGVVPCLNALGGAALASLYTAGMRELVVSRADCAACDRGRTPRFERHIADIRRLLAERRLDRLTVREMKPAAWLELRDDSAVTSRRGLFMALRAKPSAPPPSPTRTIATALPKGTGASVASPYAPRIDETACTACDACATLCPESAIRLDTATAEQAVYRMAPGLCTDCNLCVDVCDVDAVTVERWPPSPQTHVMLATARCRSCGNANRMPAGRGTADGFCRICAGVDHNRKLFQVLK